MAALLRSSKFIRYCAGLARGVIISNRQNVDGSLILKSQHVSGPFPCNFSTGLTNFRNSSNLEQAIRQLDEGARKTGRISIKEIEDALNEIRNLRKVSATQSLMVIRCCGNLVPEEVPENRTKLVQQIWSTFNKLGIKFDISHYNALLKVYLENEHSFSPTEFLTTLEKQGVEPNRVTYQRLIAGYCQMGDISGATKILEFMKEKQLPVSEGVFNALILGHSQADDMESAEGILSVMRQASLEPSNDTYCTLMCGYAKRGDSAAIERLLTDCKIKDVLLTDKDLLEVACAAAIHDHNQLLDEILKNIRTMVGYNQDAANVLLRMLTKRKDEAAYKVFLTMTPPIKTDKSPSMSGHFLIKQMVKTNRSAKEIESLCQKLEEDGHTKYGLFIAVETSFYHGNVDLTLDLLRIMKDKQEPIRVHYFWPSMLTLGKAGDPQRIMDLINTMVNEFVVEPNFETLSEYYLPFVTDKPLPEILRSLMEVGVSRRQIVLAVLFQLIEQTKLREAVAFAQQNPGVNIRNVNLSRDLVDSLQRSNDVKSAVELIHIMTINQIQDREDDDEGVEDVPGKFLTNIVSYHQTRQKIVPVLREMVSLGLRISTTCAELVESRLQGNQLTSDISDMLAQLTSAELTPVPQKRTGRTDMPPIRSTLYLERSKERAKSNNETDNLIIILRSLFQAYCDKGDIENALKTKQEYTDLDQQLTPGWWARLMELYCATGSLEEAKMCWQKIKDLNPEIEVDSAKVLKMAKLYVQNNQLEEAITLIKEAKLRREGTFEARAACWQLINAVAETTKDPEVVKKFLSLLVDYKHTEINNIILGPVIKAYILRDNLTGALKEFEECVNKYRATPWKNELATKFIEKEDASNLQTLVDLSTQVHGEINSLYDLVLSFVECGRIRQARKILETPGLNSRTDRLHFACERYRKGGFAAPLEGLVEATKDLPHIDRSDIYYNLLETYCEADNAEKAYGLWTQMQDEDVNITDEFLIKLGNLLNSKGLEVPFVIPNESQALKKEKINTPSREKKSNINESLLAAIRSRNVDEAMKIKESLQGSGTQLTHVEANRLLELLVQKDRITDALELLKSSLHPLFNNPRILNYLISKLCTAADIESLTQVGALLTEDLKKQTSFVNKYLACAVSAGKAKEELNKLESEMDAATTPEEIDRLATVFPRGGIHAVLESSPSYHDQVANIVEKYFKKGCSSPANSLCMFLLSDGQIEKAKEVYQRYNLANNSQIMFRGVLRKARIANDPKIVEELISMLHNSAAGTAEIKGVLYSNLLNIYNITGNYTTALSKLEEALKETPIENIYYRTLVRLKEGLESQNIPFPYNMPDKKKTSEYVSSSSSDDEAKQSVAAKH